MSRDANNSKKSSAMTLDEELNDLIQQCNDQSPSDSEPVVPSAATVAVDNIISIEMGQRMNLVTPPPGHQLKTPVIDITESITDDNNIDISKCY